MSEAKIGDWVVIRGTYSYDVGRVARMTPAYIWRTDDFYKSHQRADKEKVIFSGAEAVARKLKEQITSSLAQLGQDKSAAGKRHAERIAGFIAQATPTQIEGPK